ncbi:MAG TPA: TetR/AcrR family transcriptional regulator [Candidatus Rokubacteria bacterium]|nr:TetR/AcrR family transcriptional regulator [Candidatus Rokubacteria bacterium]
MRREGARRGGRRPRTGRAGYHHGDLPRALVDAALELISREGVRALTLRAAARRAGGSQAAPYRHFADKDALLAAVAEEGFRLLTASMRTAAPSTGDDPLGRFRGFGLGYVAFAAGHPAHFRVMFGREVADRARHPGLQAAGGEAFALLVDAIRACQQAGLVREGDTETLAVSAWSTVHGLAALVVDGQLDRDGSPDVAALAHAVTGSLFFGLAAPRPAGG